MTLVAGPAADTLQGVDWNLRACGRHGHETYAPDEPELRERLHVTTPAGEAWRCLRCGTFVVGEASASGPADRAPEVPRGRLLRDRTIMRLLAAERVVRGAALFFVAFLIIRFRGREQELKDTFNNDVTVLRPVAEQLGWSMDDSKIVRGISRVFELSPATLTWITIGVIGYGTLQVVEAYGLWTISRWGEYLAVVATSIFLPWEIYEVTEKITVIRVGALIINIAAVLWLLWSKRLFGLRGGAPAYHREHSAESLLTVERAAVFAASASVISSPAARLATAEASGEPPTPSSGG
jgi:uncharacterized membrane protein (DUF2068 family)